MMSREDEDRMEVTSAMLAHNSGQEIEVNYCASPVLHIKAALMVTPTSTGDE